MPIWGAMRRCRPIVIRKADGRESARQPRERRNGTDRPLEPECEPVDPNERPQEQFGDRIQDRDKREQRQGDPERQLADARGGQELREPPLDLRQAGVFVHARDVSHRVGGDQPESGSGGLRHPREKDVHALAVGQHGRARALAVNRQAVIGTAAWVTAEPIEIALEPVVEHEAQLVSGLFLADRHLLPGPLQVLGGDGSVALLGRLDKPEERAARRLAPEGIFRGGRRGLGRSRLGRLGCGRKNGGQAKGGEDEGGDSGPPGRQHRHVLAPLVILADAAAKSGSAGGCKGS